jgi:mRNA interferase YafQ
MSMVDDCIRAIAANDEVMQKRHRDHALTGDWNGYRELHFESDLLLVYMLNGSLLTLVLVRLANHDALY